MKTAEPLPTPEGALLILRRAGCSKNVIAHCKTVAEVAVRIANECRKNGADVDVRLIHIGALLHDIGRSKTHGVRHAVVGAQIARSLNLPEPVVSIIERHIGGGITAEESSEVGLPEKSYVPETLEEKIVTYADKLVDRNGVVPISKTLQKLREELGADHPAIKRTMKLHEEILALYPKGNS